MESMRQPLFMFLSAAQHQHGCEQDNADILPPESFPRGEEPEEEADGMGDEPGDPVGMDPRGRAVQKTAQDPAAVKPLAYDRILRATGFQWVNAINEIFSGAMRGYKRSTIPAAISIIGICGTRILWVHTGFAVLPTYAHLVLAYPISWAVTAVAQGVAYALVMRSRSRISHA